MDLGRFRSICLSLKGTREEYPFDEVTVAFKVRGKIFALADTSAFTTINVKVDPEAGSILREQYAAVSPGYHMNKKHWITVELDGSVPDSKLKEWIVQSYTHVIAKLTRRERLAMESL